ncbi:g4243 [Coccomyxa elongata]
MEHRPPVTLGLVAGMVLLYFQPQGLVQYVPSVSNACLQPFQILEGWQWTRLLWSAFLHADDIHLFYNMSSLLWKGAQLEPDLGSMRFLGLVGELLLLSHVATVGLAAAAAKVLPDLAGVQYYSSCAIGFSAVLFALKVVLSHRTPGWSYIGGIALPTKYVCWAELAYIQLLTPKASFLGHLGGILAGLLHVHVIEGGGTMLPELWESQGFTGRPFAGEPRFATVNGEPGPARSAAEVRARPSSAGRPPLGRGASSRQRTRDLENEESSADSRQSFYGSRRVTEPNSGDRPPVVRRPSWRQILRWDKAVLSVALLAIALASTPDEKHFVNFVREYTQRGLGFLPGFAVSSVVWLQMRAGLGFRCWNLWVCSLARYQSFWFLGLFNTWIPLPVSWAYGLLLRWRGTASNMLRDGEVRWPAPLEVLLALNVGVFLLWAFGSARRMTRHFEVSPSSLARRPWTLLTATVSHSDLYSLVGNLQMLFMVGPGLQAELGWGLFALLYAAAGAAANLSAYVGNVVIGRKRLWETKGASAPVYALLACTALVQPYRKFVWLFGVELNSLGLLGAKLLYEYVARRLGGGSVPDFWSRVVGAATGLAFASVMLECHFLDCLPKTVIPWNGRVIAASALQR